MSEPQIVELGVTPGYSPTDVGRKPDVYSSVDGKAKFSSQEELDRLKAQGKITGAYGGGQATGSARKKGPGWVWQYANPETKVEVLTYPGEALKAQEDNCRDLRLKLQEALAVVFLDPESIKFAATTSGKALQAIKQKQIDRCGQYRDDLEQRLFEPSVSMQLRIAQRMLANKQALKTPGASKVGAILDKFYVPKRKAKDAENKIVKDDTGQDVMLPEEWQMPTVYTRWGDYYAPDPAEQQTIVTMVLAALEAGVPVLTVKAAVEKLAPIFGIENVEAFLAELQKEREDRAKEALDRAQQELKAAHDLAATDDDEDGSADRSGPRSKPAKAPGGGSGGSAAADATA